MSPTLVECRGFVAPLLWIFLTPSIWAAEAAAPRHVRILPNGVTVLMADEADRSGNATVESLDPGKPMKRFWATNLTTTADALTWRVESPAGQRVEVAVVVKAATDISLVGDVGEIKATIPASSDWQRATIGALDVPAGESVIRVSLTSAPGAAPQFRAVELVPEAMKADFQDRASAMRSDTQWLREAKYGVMFQWGAWGFPERGPAKPWPEMIEDFDVDAFARMVDDDFGAGYVIWSLTWRGSQFAAPLTTVDRLVPGHTCSRDLIGELADALDRRGIKLMLYYHPGHEDAKWWAANWNPHDDKTTFVNHWCEVISEIGTRYGDRLAGWFFDDGLLYYPADFERLAKAAKAGSAKRLLSFNNWILPLMTEFQDVQFGEEYRGNSQEPVGTTGIYEGGPMKGQQAHAMIMADGPDWGIWKPNTVIEPKWDPSAFVGFVRSMNERGQALTLNLNMYEDGRISPQSRELMEHLRKEIRGR